MKREKFYRKITKVAEAAQRYHSDLRKGLNEDRVLDWLRSAVLDLERVASSDGALGERAEALVRDLASSVAKVGRRAGIDAFQKRFREAPAAFVGPAAAARGRQPPLMTAALNRHLVAKARLRKLAVDARGRFGNV